MLDQNTDRMWYVIGAVLVGAAIILIANGTLPDIFASVTESFEEISTDATGVVDAIAGDQEEYILQQNDIVLDMRAKEDGGEITNYRALSSGVSFTILGNEGRHMGVRFTPNEESGFLWDANKTYEITYDIRAIDGELDHVSHDFINLVTATGQSYINEEQYNLQANLPTPVNGDTYRVRMIVRPTADIGIKHRFTIYPNGGSHKPVSVRITNFNVREM